MIHKEGIKISSIIIIALFTLNAALFLAVGRTLVLLPSLIASLLFMTFILRFFRKPVREVSFRDGFIFAPADGRVVVIEETTEKEYLKEKRIQVSVFMSLWNVHINWYPVGGHLSYYKYHPGKYLVARNPKSSTLNERNTVVIRTRNGTEILVRQIAGTVARRIISYSREGKEVLPGDEMGFIRFGSRVDTFLPPDCKILVKPGQKVRGLNTPLAQLK